MRGVSALSLSEARQRHAHPHSRQMHIGRIHRADPPRPLPPTHVHAETRNRPHPPRQCNFSWPPNTRIWKYGAQWPCGVHGAAAGLPCMVPRAWACGLHAVRRACTVCELHAATWCSSSGIHGAACVAQLYTTQLQRQAVAACKKDGHSRHARRSGNRGMHGGAARGSPAPSQPPPERPAFAPPCRS